MSLFSFYYRPNQSPETAIVLTPHDRKILQDIEQEIANSDNIMLQSIWESMRLDRGQNEVLLQANWRDHIDTMIRNANDSGEAEVASLLRQIQENFESTDENISSMSSQASQLEHNIDALSERILQSIENGRKLGLG